MDFYVEVKIIQRPIEAYVSGPPEDCYPAEAGEFEIETLIDEKGKAFECDYLKELLEEDDNFIEKVWSSYDE